MRILQIFNRYAYIGGEEIAVEQISRELSAHHELLTITFDTRKWVDESGFINRIHQLYSMIWNRQAIAQVRDAVEAHQPDIILIHNLMPIGSAGLPLYLRDCGIPVVQFIHNFRPFSVNGYCWGNGKLLPQGIQKNFLPEILAASWQNSRIKTAWYALIILTLHRLGVYQGIHGWIAISNFMRETFIKGGIPADRIRVIPHGWNPQSGGDEPGPAKSTSEDPVFLFLGRITEEKGLRVLLDAWTLLESLTDRGTLLIAGDGPLASEVRERCVRLRRATYLGFQTGDAKRQLLRNCTAMVVPSVWWEPLGLVLYEAYDYGKPVLAARSGGIVDHVNDGVTGWIHEPGDSQMLAAHLLEAASSTETCRIRGANGRNLLLERSSSSWIDEFNDFVGGIAARTSMRGMHAGVPAPETRDKADTDRRPRNPLLDQDLKSRITISVYLADQNPGYDRSFGISRMTRMVLEALLQSGRVTLETISSKTSQQSPAGTHSAHVLPWGTRIMWMRLFSDHFHPLFHNGDMPADVYYFPKGYLPWCHQFCQPSVVTIHDTIIQYDEDHYPQWRKRREYAYWAWILKHTLRHAEYILTVSENSKRQIHDFMDRHGIPRNDITVTYEPCVYERIPQPENPAKENYVIHLVSREPHKRTAHLIRWWHEAEAAGLDLPTLHLIGSVPPEVEPLLASARTLVKRPFLEEAALQAAYLRARALILPSEIEGFGLPALEAYYLGTPVCFVLGTSVEEVLSVAQDKGGFSLDSLDSLFSALETVMCMSPEEVRACGLRLRETYAAEKVAGRMLAVFHKVAEEHDSIALSDL